MKPPRPLPRPHPLTGAADIDTASAPPSPSTLPSQTSAPKDISILLLPSLRQIRRALSTLRSLPPLLRTCPSLPDSHRRPPSLPLVNLLPSLLKLPPLPPFTPPSFPAALSSPSTPLPTSTEEHRRPTSPRQGVRRSQDFRLRRRKESLPPLLRPDRFRQRLHLSLQRRRMDWTQDRGPALQCFSPSRSTSRSWRFGSRSVDADSPA
jgi:hypothetical protein